MAFPRKWQRLLETDLSDVEVPDYVWLSYAVCGVTKDACGWGGWMIEGAFKRTGRREASATGDRVLSAVDDQICPQCGGTLFRTAAAVRLEPSADQEPPLQEGVDYKAQLLEYTD
jgi:hypothetical protein